MANKTPEDIAAMVNIAREQLNVMNLIRNASASARDEQIAAEQMEKFREIFAGWTSQELKDLRGPLLQSFDNDMQNTPLRINGNDNPERQKLNKAMRNVFQNLFDIETAMKKEESAVARMEVEVVDDAVAQNSAVEPAAPKTVEPSRTLLQKIKAIVDKGVQQINEKAAEVKTNIETRAKERKIEKALKKFEGLDPLQIISSNAEKAINKIRSLGERASAKIMGLVAKVRPSKVYEQDIEMSVPTGFRHVEGQSKNTEATLAAKASLDTGHANEVDAKYADAPPAPSDPKIAAPPEPSLDDLLKDLPDEKVENPVTQAELDDLLKGLEAEEVKEIDQAWQKDIGENFDRLMDELQQDVSEVTSSFSKAVEVVVKAEDVKMATGIKDIKKPGPSAGELAVQKEADEMMSALDEALKGFDEPASNASKTSDPGTPRSGNDSGPSTPRGP
jgi:hypothetical protein